LTAYEDELVELEGTYPKMKIRRSLLNDLWHNWLIEVGSITPRQAELIRKTIAFALLEAKYLSCTKGETEK